jgi:hypothetical protein
MLRICSGEFLLLVPFRPNFSITGLVYALPLLLYISLDGSVLKGLLNTIPVAS